MEELAAVLCRSPLTRLKIGRQRELQRTSLFDNAPSELKSRVMKQALAQMQTQPALDRAVGAMVGMAVADSLGHNFEFLPARNIPNANYLEYPAKNGTPGGVIVGRYNQFDLRPGQWTDDASMGLCLADALIVQAGIYDGTVVRTWFHNWWFNGLNNAFRLDTERKNTFCGDSLSVGLGGNIAQSLREIERCSAQGIPVPARFGATNSDAGNGSLMRLAAVPVLHHANITTAREVAFESSLTTHPGTMAAEACAFLAHTICRAIHWGSSGCPNQQNAKLNSKTFLDEVVAEYLEDVLGAAPQGDESCCGSRTKTESNEGQDAIRRLLLSAEPTDGTEAVWNWREQNPGIEQTLAARGHFYNGYPVSAGYFGAFSIDGLAIALHSFYHTDSFNDAVVKCVNFCGDADTTGAICAQLAGAFYGYSAIDAQWVKEMQQWACNEIELRAALLFTHGENPLLKTAPPMERTPEPASELSVEPKLCDAV